MLKAIGWLFKTSVFALVFVVIGLLVSNYRVGHRTISEQVRTQLSHAESAAEATGMPKAASSLKNGLEGWAHGVTSDQKAGISRKIRKMRASTREALGPRRPVKIVDEEISSSERQKLRALMRELNSSRASSN